MRHPDTAEAERQLALLASAETRPATRLLRAGDRRRRHRTHPRGEIPALLSGLRRPSTRAASLGFVPASGAACACSAASPRSPSAFPKAAKKFVKLPKRRRRRQRGPDLAARLPPWPSARELEERRPGVLAGPRSKPRSPRRTPLFELSSPRPATLLRSPTLRKGFSPSTGPAIARALRRGAARRRQALSEGDDGGLSRFHFTVAADFRRPFAARSRARRDLRRDRRPLRSRLFRNSSLATQRRPRRRRPAGLRCRRPSAAAAVRAWACSRTWRRPAAISSSSRTSTTCCPGGTPRRARPLEGGHPWPASSSSSSPPEEAARGDDRPWRVCGVVANTGEPGGGPFWVEDAGRPGLAADRRVGGGRAGDAGQLGIFRGSTHFNPVDLVVALRDSADRPRDLAPFVDPARCLVAAKSEGGRRPVYERPGLWNGAMAGWNTLFVEVPAWTFAPVKTVPTSPVRSISTLPVCACASSDPVGIPTWAVPFRLERVMTRLFVPRKRSAPASGASPHPRERQEAGSRRTGGRRRSRRRRRGAGFPDDAYRAAGYLAGLRRRGLPGADIVFKVAPPEMSESRTAVAGHLSLLAARSVPQHRARPDPGRPQVTVFAMELVPRTTRGQALDVLSSQASIAGWQGGAGRRGRSWARSSPLLMTAAGTIQPARSWCSALASPVHGARDRQAAGSNGRGLRRPPGGSRSRSNRSAAGSSTCRRCRPPKAPVATPKRSRKSSRAAAGDPQRRGSRSPTWSSPPPRCRGQAGPILLTRDMVEAMKPGSVVVDIVAAQGGNCELTQVDAEVEHQGRLRPGPSNLPATPSRPTPAWSTPNLFDSLDDGLQGQEVGDSGERRRSDGTLLARDGALVHPAFTAALVPVAG